MKALWSFTSCLVRHVNEDLSIEMSTADCMMSSKSEFNQAPLLVRVVPVVGLREEQGVEQQGGGVHGGGRGRCRGRARSNG